MITEPVWASRNKLLDQFNLLDCSVVDFGCGDKSVLNYQTFKEYIGLDIAPTADIQINFDKDNIELDKKYDVGLVLGVLEYLDSPAAFVKSIQPFADRFIIMILERDVVKAGWRNAFTQESLDQLLAPIWKNRTYSKHNTYVIAECTNKD